MQQGGLPCSCLGEGVRPPASFFPLSVLGETCWRTVDRSSGWRVAPGVVEVMAKLDGRRSEGSPVLQICQTDGGH